MKVKFKVYIVLESVVSSLESTLRYLSLRITMYGWRKIVRFAVNIIAEIAYLL